MTRLAAQDDRNLDISILAVLAYFVSRCREKLHMVLCLSPIGDAFRIRLRMYPSLVNCCTIDWFDEWPEDALEQVTFFVCMFLVICVYVYVCYMYSVTISLQTNFIVQTCLNSSSEMISSQIASTRHFDIK